MVNVVSTTTTSESSPAKTKSSGVHGILSINKPIGITSFDVVRSVRRIFGEKKVGHAGTLDPNAEGVLPICIGQATRLVDYFHQQPKEYLCKVRLGERSNTLDTEGIIETGGDASKITAEIVGDALAKFIGEIKQILPMYSAARHEGKHLYELARAGIEVERKTKVIQIYGIELLSFTPGVVATAEFAVTCGKGAYMRVLASDLGESLGVGGLLEWLNRTKYGELKVEESVSLDQLLEMSAPTEALLPFQVAVAHLPRVDLVPAMSRSVNLGQSVWLPKTNQYEQGINATYLGNQLLAVGNVQANLFKPIKVFHANLP